MSVLTFDVGLAHKLKKSFAAADWEEEDINLLAESDQLSAIRHVLHDRASIKVEEHIIDCDAAPLTPDGWTVEEHQKGGQYQFDAAKVSLWLSKAQQKGSIAGNKLRKEMEDKPVLNANVLDYLRANPHLIPLEWKGKYVFFWGTVYRDRVGDLAVRCLFWDSVRWRWGDRWLDYSWRDIDPAALRAS